MDLWVRLELLEMKGRRALPDLVVTMDLMEVKDLLDPLDPQDPLETQPRDLLFSTAARMKLSI